MFDLERAIHRNTAARLSGATKASARMIARASEEKRLAAMQEHRRLARMAMQAWTKAKGD